MFFSTIFAFFLQNTSKNNQFFVTLHINSLDINYIYNMALIHATQLNQIYRAFRNEPLAQDELKEFYRDAAEARGEKTRVRLERQLRVNMDTNEHILLVGYKGCGKSTELNLLEHNLNDEFLVMNISVQRELDPVHVQYIELFIVMMEQLFQKADQYGLKLRDELLKSVKTWTQSKEIEEIREKYIGGELEAGGGFDIKYFVNFFAKFKLAAKSSQSLKVSLKDNVEPRLNDLITHCNDLINEIRLRLNDIGKKDLLIIIEDLDKIPINRAQDLFYNYTNQLVRLNTNIIYTFPVALYYNVRFNQIKSYFSKIYELPMISTSNPDGSDNQSGIQIMRDIVEARMDIGILFEKSTLLDNMIRRSGGVIRDLFLLINEAADSAMDHDRTSMNTEDCENGFNRLRKDYDNNIADKREGDKILITADQYYATLARLIQSTEKKVDNTEAALDLRQNLSILGYNGKGWCDVHPIVKEILRERGKI